MAQKRLRRCNHANAEEGFAHLRRAWGGTAPRRRPSRRRLATGPAAAWWPAGAAGQQTGVLGEVTGDYWAYANQQAGRTMAMGAQ